jgi:hypothetical protein
MAQGIFAGTTAMQDEIKRVTREMTSGEAMLQGVSYALMGDLDGYNHLAGRVGDEKMRQVASLAGYRTAPPMLMHTLLLLGEKRWSLAAALALFLELRPVQQAVSRIITGLNGDPFCWGLLGIVSGCVRVFPLGAEVHTVVSIEVNAEHTRDDHLGRLESYYKGKDPDRDREPLLLSREDRIVLLAAGLRLMEES